MVNPDEIGSFFQTNWWEGFSTFGAWLGYVFVGLVLLAIIILVYTLIQFKVNVTYFPVMGDPHSSTVTLGRPKKDRGRRTKHKGVEVFQLLFARKTLKDIPYKLEYPDGVYLLRKSRDEFEPVPRPSLGNPSVVLNTVDSALQLWAQLRSQQIRKRFVDEDWQKKQMFIFVGVIIGCLVFAGVVIWMSYATSNATLDKLNAVTGPLNTIAEKIGLGGP